jgi:Protein-disulfide isomerase
MKRYLPFAIVAIVGAVTLASGIGLYRAKRAPIVATAKGSTSVADRSDTGHVLGSAEAPVTLEEFGDYQCPPCGRIATVIGRMEQDYRPRLRIIFRNLPFAIHAHAHEAALAAEAAALQGRFWEMHDLLYKEQAAWSSAADARVLFESYAGMIGLDLERFRRDMDGEATKARVAADQQRATSLGVTSTPSIFINNEPLPHTSLNSSGLRAAIDAAMKSSPTGRNAES